jgi:hypothetical protein
LSISILNFGYDVSAKHQEELGPDIARKMLSDIKLKITLRDTLLVT